VYTHRAHGTTVRRHTTARATTPWPIAVAYSRGHAESPGFVLLLAIRLPARGGGTRARAPPQPSARASSAMRSAYAEEARWLSGLGFRAPQRLVRAGQPRQARPSFRQSARPRRSSLASSSPNAAASPCRRLRPLGSCWRLASSPHCIVYLFRGEQHDASRKLLQRVTHSCCTRRGVYKAYIYVEHLGIY
jgi:hypothetical protein